MRLSQVQPYCSRGKSLDHLRDERAVVQGLAHLLTGSGHECVVHPEVREALTRGSGLSQLVLVVRKTKINSAAMDVELVAEVLAGHGRALQMPPRSAPAPRRRPARSLRLGFLVALPQCEIPWILLPARIGVRGRLHIVDVLVRQ